MHGYNKAFLIQWQPLAVKVNKLEYIVYNMYIEYFAIFMGWMD